MKRYHIEVGKLKTPEELLRFFQQLMGKFEVTSEHYETLDDEFKAICIEAKKEDWIAPYDKWYEKVFASVILSILFAGSIYGLCLFIKDIFT